MVNLKCMMPLLRAADWPAFDITLRLDGREVTVHWQRTERDQLLAQKPDQIVKAGDIVRLAELPANALVWVVGERTGETS